MIKATIKDMTITIGVYTLANLVINLSPLAWFLLASSITFLTFELVEFSYVVKALILINPSLLINPDNYK